MSVPSVLRIHWNGRPYTWENQYGYWRDSNGVQVHQDTAVKISTKFISTEASKIIRGSRDSDDRSRFFDILSAMGASDSQVIELGGWEHVYRDDPFSASDLIIEELPPAGHTFLNCPILRDQYFDVLDECSFAYTVALVGSAPFEIGDMSEFLSSHEIEHRNVGPDTKVVILGRRQWTKTEVDNIIDRAAGPFLRFYSQEMFLSVCAGQPDPFDYRSKRERLSCLNAFKTGHAGLEYVSQGWEGWVFAGLETRGQSLTSGKDDGIDRASESPLNAMGYRTGNKGLKTALRRELLKDAFTGELPFVESHSYMDEWGTPRTGKRLKRIAQQLTTNIKNFKSRSNADRYKKAIAEWHEDLDWLRKTFYRGAYKFDWPTGKKTRIE